MFTNQNKMLNGVAKLNNGEEFHLFAYGNDTEGVEAYVSFIENDTEIIVKNIIGTWKDVENLMTEMGAYNMGMKLELAEC